MPAILIKIYRFVKVSIKKADGSGGLAPVQSARERPHVSAQLRRPSITGHNRSLVVRASVAYLLCAAQGIGIFGV